MGNFMQSAVSLKGKLKSACNYVKTYWDKAPANRYLSFKEAAAYCIGGIGINAATMVPIYLTLTYGMYVAAALGISNDIIMWVGIITSVITILRSPLISYLVDNTNTKYGKFRPYLIWMPVPCTILIALMGWTPTIMSGASQIAIVAVYTVMFNLMQFFMQLYTLAFTSIMQVISPSPEERTVIMSVGTTVYSLGPTIINALFPLLANMIFTVKGGGGLSEDGVAQDLLGVNTMGPYEWILPVMTVAFFAIGYITVFGVKERMVLPRKKKMRVPFFKGVVDTLKNKYVMLANASGILGAFRVIIYSYINWVCTYMIISKWSQTIALTIIPMAYTPGMLLAPILIKKFGKKNLILFSNFACVFFTGIMFGMTFVGGGDKIVVGWSMFVLSFMLTLANSVQVVTNYAITAQQYDYQQFRTGERMEGFLSQFGSVLNTLAGIGFAFITPAINKHYGYVDDTSVLYNANVIIPILRMYCVLGIISGALGAVPMFFWDMTEQKHREIMEVLKVRAGVQDGQIDETTGKELETKLLGGDEFAWRDYMAEHGIEDSIKQREEQEEKTQVQADGAD